ncbi:hypothetical protein KSP40_PGU005438 [Platanthera guangdongensis]|uniref:Uncharacterized protein n=1 Tax=Platanthera guangdongensis TaxID=2320717 RepID=A0ABR2MWV3_9ASPA
MARPAMSAGALALALSLALILALLLLLDLLRSLLRHRAHPPASLEAEHATPPSPSNLSPANLSPFYAHGVLRAPTKFLLSSPKLEALLPPASPDAAGGFVCISNPVYDEVTGKETVEAEDGHRSPELTVMRKLPSKTVPAGFVVAGRRFQAKSASATKTNGTSFSSELLCSSPSF